MSAIDLSWEVWEPIYEAILADFGFPRGADEAARDQLAEACRDHCLVPADLPDARGKEVAIVGGAAGVPEELDLVHDADLVFGASTASVLLGQYDVSVDVHVTDLDKDIGLTIDRTQRGKPVVLHAHGDNRDALSRYVPEMDTAAVLPTTQAKPAGCMHNPGGFTDGDRAAFLAHALGADSLVFAGWEFDDPDVGPIKRRKLMWAARLLFWLELRRDDRFAVLDGRRQDLDLEAFPDPPE